MGIIQTMFFTAGTLTQNEFNQNTPGKPLTSVISFGEENLLSFSVPAGVSNVSVEAWGAGGASGSSVNGVSGSGGGGGYISAVIPVDELNINSLIVKVGGGGGNPDYYASPLAEYTSTNRSTISLVGSNSVSSNPTFSTVSPVPGSTLSSSNSVTYSTISPVAGAAVSSVSSATYSTITSLGSVTGANTTTLDLTTLPGGALQAGDIVLVSSTCVSGTIPPLATYTEVLAGTNNVSYRVSYKIMGATPDTSVSGLDDVIGGNGVAHIASVFRGVSLDTAIITTINAQSSTNDPNPPPVTPDISGCTSVAFGFVPTRAYGAANITLPANYGNLEIQAVATGTAEEESTVMNAYRSNIQAQVEENPGVFNIPNNENCIGITVLLRPQQTLSAISGSMTLSGLADGDIILVSSVSDGPPLPAGTINLPSNTGFQSLSVSGAGASPAYRVSWKKVTSAELSLGSYTITGLSLSGTISGGPANGDPAGIAHYATAFRGVDSALTTPIITPVPSTTGTGNPDSPSVSPTTANHTIVSFGFLADRSLPIVAAPTNSYTLLPNSVLTTGSDANGTSQATSMVAYRSLGASLDGNPNPFTVSGSANTDYAAVTVGLIPSRTLSAIPGFMIIPGLQANDIVLVSSVSDVGTMSPPSAPSSGLFETISSSTGGSPAYGVFWKRITALDLVGGSLTISGLSLSGGVPGGLATGVAHHATAFRGVDATAANPFITAPASTGTGNPNSPSVGPFPTTNYTSVSFGFLNNTGFPTVSPPTTPSAYIQLSTLAVSDDTPGTEATSMVAYRTSLGSGVSEDPGAFTVSGVGGENYAAVTVALRPQVQTIADTSTLTLSGLQENDIVLVSSISDGGTMLPPGPPGSYSLLGSGSNNNQPAYQLSWRRVLATDLSLGTLTIGGLTTQGTVQGGDNNGDPAGVAHVAMAFRGCSLTASPRISTPSTGNGAPNSPSIGGLIAGDTVVSFGLLDDRSVTATAPTNYTTVRNQAVGTDAEGNDEATIMSAYRILATTTGTEDPNAFGSPSDNYVGLTVALTTNANNRFSTTPGACGGSGGGFSGIFYTPPGGILTPLLIAGGGGGGGGATVASQLPSGIAAGTPQGGNGGAGGGLPGLNGNAFVLNALSQYFYAGQGGSGGGDNVITFGVGLGGATYYFNGISALVGNLTNRGENGATWDDAIVAGFSTGGRGANSPSSDTTTTPLYGANATGGWIRGSGGGSSRTSSALVPVSIPSDCGGAGGSGYNGGGGGGSGAGGGGGGGGGGSNYVNPAIFANANIAGIGTIPANPLLDGLGNPDLTVGYGGNSVTGTIGNPGQNGLVIISYLA